MSKRAQKAVALSWKEASKDPEQIKRRRKWWRGYKEHHERIKHFASDNPELAEYIKSRLLKDS